MEGGKKEHGEVQCARSLEVMYIGVRLSVFRGVHCPRARPRRPQTCLFSLLFVDFKTLEMVEMVEITRKRLTNLET